MKWTIKKKILILAMLVFVALAFLAGMTFFQNLKVMDAMHQNELRTRDRNLIEDLRLAQVELVLAAADSMIEKENGEIPQERMELIRSRTQFLEKHLNDLEQTAETAEQKTAVARIRQGIQALNPAIENELVTLVEQSAQKIKAIEDRFEKVQADIEAQSQGMAQDLMALNDVAKKEFDLAQKEAKDLGRGEETSRTLSQSYLALMLAVTNVVMDAKKGTIEESNQSAIELNLERFRIFSVMVKPLLVSEAEKKTLDETLADFDRLSGLITGDMTALVLSQDQFNELAWSRFQENLKNYSKLVVKGLQQIEKFLQVRAHLAEEMMGQMFQTSLLTAQLNRAQSNLHNAALEAIVHKKKGRVSEATQEIIQESIQFIDRNLPLVSATVNNDRGKQLIASVNDRLPGLAKLISQDLRDLIEKEALEQQAILEDFNALQNAVRENNAPVQKNLTLVADALGEQASKTDSLLKSRLNGAQTIGLIVFAVVLMLILPGFLMLSRNIAGALARGLKLATAVKDGDLSQRLDVKGSDELAQMAQALNTMADSLEKKAELAQTIAQGDLSRDVALSSDKDLLGRALREMVGKLSGLLSQVHEAATQVTTGATQISESSEALSADAAHQASSLEEITSAMIQIGRQTQTNADDAHQADQSAREARDSAQEGHGHMGKMVEAMGDINTSSQEIAKIIKTIDDIAFQTNLLALNAAVEAARAGKHGKGFAVVAQEVRGLAVRSAKASGETAELIENTVKKVKNGTQVAQETAQALEAITSRITQVSELVGGIASASQEQALGISQINQSLNEVDRVTQKTVANAEETASAAAQLTDQAEIMRGMVTRFRLKDHRGPEPADTGRSIPAETGGSENQPSKKAFQPNRLLPLEGAQRKKS